MYTQNQPPDLQRFAGSGEGNPEGEPLRTAETGAPEERSLEALLKASPELRAQYDARVKQELRLRNRKGQTGQETAPVLEALAKRYGMEWSGDNQQELLRALKEDKPPVTRQQTLESLRHQVELIRSRDPDFRLGRAMANPGFGSLVTRGVPVLYAWLLTRQRQDMTRAMGYAIDRTRKAMTDQLRAGNFRPRETAGQGRVTGLQSPDPGSMTAQERKALRQRVARGEKIYW